MQVDQFIKDVSPSAAREQRIPWHPAKWRNAFPQQQEVVSQMEDWSDADQEGWMLLPRTAVFGIREPSADDLLVAAMVWGFGSIAYGCHRTVRMFRETPEVSGRLRAIVEAARKDADSGYLALWNDASSVKHLKTAMGTKLLYFAGFDRDKGQGPLVLDKNMLRALNHIEGVSFPMEPNRITSVEYCDYIEKAQQWGDQAHADPDAVECELFELGKKLAPRKGPKGAGSRPLN